MKEYINTIKKIFVSNDAKEFSLTKDILGKLKHADVEYIDDVKGMDSYFEDAKDKLSLGKQTLYLAVNKGDVLKKCPGSRGRVCCNYYIFSPVINCPFDCSYCFLQEYISCPAIIINVNIDQMLDKVKNVISSKPDYFWRVGTGETADSLALDELTLMGDKIIRTFWELDNAQIELKTKSANVDFLPVNEKQNVVIAWSLNPAKVIEKQEKQSASLEERLSAAAQVVKKGYKTAFHFDPVFHYEGWESDYNDVIKALFAKIDIKDVSWISMGTFRYQPSFKAIFNKRFKESNIMLEEFVSCEDGKMRYLKFLRSEMFKKMKKNIENACGTKKVPFYMCMESKEMWENTFGYLPADNDNISNIFRQI